MALLTEYDSTTLAAVCILQCLECLVDVIIDRIVGSRGGFD